MVGRSDAQGWANLMRLATETRHGWFWGAYGIVQQKIQWHGNASLERSTSAKREQALGIIHIEAHAQNANGTGHQRAQQCRGAQHELETLELAGKRKAKRVGSSDA